MQSNLDAVCKRIYLSFRKLSRFPYPTNDYWCFVSALCALLLLSYLGFLFTSSALWRLSFFCLAYTLSAILAISVGHQAYHGVLLPSKRWNRILGTLSFLPLGVDGPLWRTRHLRDHHPHPNTQGHDADLDNPSFLRLAPYTQRRSYHRVQHLYAPLLYSLGVPLTILLDDFRALLRELSGLQREKKISTVLMFLFGKLTFFSLWFLFPALLRPELGVGELTLDFLLASVPTAWIFLPIAAAHLNTHTEFFEDKAEQTFAALQAETTIDFSRESRFLTYIYGGLNCHLAHHVWPRASCSHYRALFKELQRSGELSNQVGKNLAIPELIHSHLRFLRLMGR